MIEKSSCKFKKKIQIKKSFKLFYQNFAFLFIKFPFKISLQKFQTFILIYDQSFLSSSMVDVGWTGSGLFESVTVVVAGGCVSASSR